MLVCRVLERLLLQSLLKLVFFFFLLRTAMTGSKTPVHFHVLHCRVKTERRRGNNGFYAFLLENGTVVWDCHAESRTLNSQLRSHSQIRVAQIKIRL